jgi:hypothetical protein
MTVPHVVYHIAAMGNWEKVISEQFLSLRISGLSKALTDIGDSVRITFVGDLSRQHLIEEEAARQDIPIIIVRADSNVLHYETFAMLEIERLAKEECTVRPILYMHTKGVSVPGDYDRSLWRKVMHRYVVSDWKKNCQIITDDYDAIGWNWWNHGRQHFSGTFWIANADFIRKLPSFVAFHTENNFVRYSCELWIGSSRNCRAYSLGTSGVVTWDCGFNYAQHLDLTDKITWISAATNNYSSDLCALQLSFQKLGSGHQLRTMLVQDKPWRHCYKLDIIKTILPTISTPYVFWIDADCEFLCNLDYTDLVHPNYPISCLRHLAYNRPQDTMPSNILLKVASDATGYWQACLFGGTVKGMSQLIERVSWIHSDPRGYDEHALNVDFQNYPVHTLPCRYGAPSSFSGMPQYEKTYHERSDGIARIVHKSREINR